jgi:hypothetical protein
MSVFKNILYDFILNFLVALSVFFQSLVSARYFVPENDRNNILQISAFNFFISWAAYHVLRHDRKKHESSYVYRRYFFIILFISAGAGFNIGQKLYSALNLNQILNYVFSFILVILYGIKSTGFRQRLIVRYITIVLVWFSVTVLTFILFNEKSNSLSKLSIFSLSRSLLFFICILPFDIIDKESDRKDNTSTLAHRLSEKRMYTLIGIILSVLILISYRELFSLLVVVWMMAITIWLSKKSVGAGKLLAESILAVEGILNLLIG